MIDETIKIAGLTSANQLAQVLGVSRSAISVWRRGTSLPDATQAAQIAVLQGREPLAGVAAVEMERHRDNPKAVRFWQSQLRNVREFILC